MMSLLRRALGRPSADSPWISGTPAREELFSAERLEQHARSLAVAQTVTPNPTRGHLLSGRLATNNVVLLNAYRTTAQSTEAGRAITPAAEWLVDNYYLVEREIREIRAALPSGHYRQLPKLLGGPFAGQPRAVSRAFLRLVRHARSAPARSTLCLLRGAGGQPGLWPMGISGGLPIVRLRIADIENLGIARQLPQAHEYGRMKQLAVDLVILNERASSYVQDLQSALETQGRASQSLPPVGVERHDRVFVLRADLVSPEARALLASVARVVLMQGGTRR